MKFPVKSDSKGKSDASIYQDVNLKITISITLIAVLGATSINPALPAIAQNFQVSPQQIGWVITAFVIPIAIGTPIFGTPICGVLADRFGRR